MSERWQEHRASQETQASMEQTTVSFKRPLLQRYVWVRSLELYVHCLWYKTVTLQNWDENDDNVAFLSE